MVEELKIRYEEADLLLLNSHGGNWWTHDAQNKGHTAGVIPSTYDPLSKRESWCVNGEFHRESGKTWVRGHESSKYWDLHGKELKGRLLLWQRS